MLEQTRPASSVRRRRAAASSTGCSSSLGSLRRQPRTSSRRDPQRTARRRRHARRLGRLRAPAAPAARVPVAEPTREGPVSAPAGDRSAHGARASFPTLRISDSEKPRRGAHARRSWSRAGSEHYDASDSVPADLDASRSARSSPTSCTTGTSGDRGRDRRGLVLLLAVAGPVQRSHRCGVERRVLGTRRWLLLWPTWVDDQARRRAPDDEDVPRLRVRGRCARCQPGRRLPPWLAAAPWTTSASWEKPPERVEGGLAGRDPPADRAAAGAVGESAGRAPDIGSLIPVRRQDLAADAASRCRLCLRAISSVG